MQNIIVAISGASSLLYAKNLLQHMQNKAIIHLVISSNTHSVLKTEETYFQKNYPQNYQELLAFASYHYEPQDFTAPIASGTYPIDAMIVIPCSMNTLAHIAHGITQNLIHRAADVSLKEKRNLIIVPRETPLNSIHLQNMLTLSQMGATIMPPIPALYTLPDSIEQLIDIFSLRILNMVNIKIPMPRWE